MFVGLVALIDLSGSLEGKTFAGELGRLVKEVAQHWFLFLGLFGILIAGMTGLIGRGLGLQNVFHDDRNMVALYYPKSGIEVFRNSPTLFAQMALVMFSTMIWGFAHTLGLNDTEAGGTVATLLSTVWPQIVLFILVGIAAGMLPSRPPESRVKLAWVRALIGAAVGVLLALLTIWLATLLEPLLPGEWVNRPTYALAIVTLVMTVALVGAFGKKLLVAISLIVLMTFLAIAYALLATLPQPSHLGAFLMVGLWIVLATGALAARAKGAMPLKFRFDGFVPQGGPDPYDPEHRLKLGELFDSASDRREEQRLMVDPFRALERWRAGEWPFGRVRTAAGPPGVAAPERAERPRPDYVEPHEALENWRAGTGPGEKPKLVLVATSGGAYRASFWTAFVLDELVRRDKAGDIPGFARNVRLITGASGGMVAGAYFAALADQTSPHPPQILAQLEADILAAQTLGGPGAAGFPYPSRFPVPRDSLSPVAQQLVQRDFTGLFKPGASPIDRGDVLERQWLTLRRDFASLAPGERQGWRPSILFSPMIVETGQPMLITNLDMDRLLAGRATETAVLFDWFPAAHSTFELRTAVRMNAAFPYVSPSTALPTEPYRRLVDAGYYDNYGIDLAVAYLAAPQIRDWVVANTSGVAIIEIRAFPHAEPPDRDTSPFLSAFQFLTTPVEGMLAARGSTMTFRNSQSFRRLQQTYDLALNLAGKSGGIGGADFLRKFTFELRDAETSMTWYLPEHELARMLTYLGAPENSQSFAELEAFW